jgi:hypothetical protein
MNAIVLQASEIRINWTKGHVDRITWLFKNLFRVA